jgi:general secretion pathway protein C
MASKRARQKAPAKIPPKTAERIVAIALQNPELGARRLVPLLKKKRISVSATSVQNILRRNGLQTRALRLAKSKKKIRRPKSPPKKSVVRITDAVAARIVDISQQNPDLGARRLLPLLKKEKIRVPASTVYSILKRHGLQSRSRRLAERDKRFKKAHRPKAGPKKSATKIRDQIAGRICEIALRNPDLGPKRLVPLLEEQGIFAASSAVYRFLKRNGLQTRQRRLDKAAETTAQPVIFPKKFPDKIPPEVEDRIVELSLENPDLGARRLMRLLQQEDIFVSATSVYKILKRNDIENRPKRLLKLKKEPIPETPPEFEIELPEPADVPAHLAPMPPEDEIPESLQDQEDYPSLPIEDEIWEPALEPVELAPEPDQDEIPEPLSGPEENEMPKPVFEPAEAVPIPPAAEALVPVEEPERVPERIDVTPAEPEPPPARKTLIKLPRKKSHWIFYPLYLLLLLLIGYLGFQTVQAIQIARLEADAVAASGPEGVRPEVESQASTRPLSDYQVIWQRNLFNVIPAKDSEKKEEISLDNIALAKKDLGLELVGTVVADDPDLSRAIIDNRKTREQEAYREGDNAGKVKIKKILRNNVIITTAKGDELLTVEIKESAKRSTSFAPSKSNGSRSPSSSQTSGNQQSSARSTRSLARTRSIKLKREEVETSLANVDALMEKVNVTPYMQGDQPSGFRISNIPADSVLRKMGLRSRDVIVGVDDDEITSPDQASDFFERLAAGEEVTIRVKRRRRTRQIKLNIE